MGWCTGEDFRRRDAAVERFQALTRAEQDAMTWEDARKSGCILRDTLDIARWGGYERRARESGRLPADALREFLEMEEER